MTEPQSERLSKEERYAIFAMLLKERRKEAMLRIGKLSTILHVIDGVLNHGDNDSAATLWTEWDQKLEGECRQVNAALHRVKMAADDLAREWE